MKVINTQEATVHGKLTHAAIKRVWDAFLNGGTSHSAGAFTLTHIINRCEDEGIAYRLSAHPGHGYHIEPFTDGD